MRNHSISNKPAFAFRFAIGNKLLIEIRLFYSITKALFLKKIKRSVSVRAEVVVFECNGRIFIGIITRLPVSLKVSTTFYFAKLFFLFTPSCVLRAFSSNFITETVRE